MKSDARCLLWVLSILGISSIDPFISSAQNLDIKIVRVRAPVGVTFTVNDERIKTLYQSGRYTLYFEKPLSLPFTLSVHGPLGGIVLIKIASPDDTQSLVVDQGIIQDKNTRPESLSILPALCPRISFKNNPTAAYDAGADRLNRIPIMQLLDPDAKEGEQYKTFSEMDGKNVLALQRVTLRYDYEDSNIVDFDGSHPLTGRPHVVYEGDGGFYANLHYSVVPYSGRILKMDRQTLLHLAQGKLEEIDSGRLRPRLRTHAFIPGPFLSKKRSFYDLCEWGDTAYQAPVQTMEYRGMALWDWDYSIMGARKIILIVWEGDEEDWLVSEKLIDPFYLTDDLIGVFVLRRRDTLQPLKLENASRDFEMVVQTGDL